MEIFEIGVGVIIFVICLRVGVEGWNWMQRWGKKERTETEKAWNYTKVILLIIFAMFLGLSRA